MDLHFFRGDIMWMSGGAGYIGTSAAYEGLRTLVTTESLVIGSTVARILDQEIPEDQGVGMLMSIANAR